MPMQRRGETARAPRAALGRWWGAGAPAHHGGCAVSAPVADRPVHRRLAAATAGCLGVGLVLGAGDPGTGGVALTGAAAVCAGLAGLYALVVLFSRERLVATWVNRFLDVVGATAVSLSIVALLLLGPLRAATGLGAGAVLLLVPGALALVVLCVSVATVLLVRAPLDDRQVALGVGATTVLVAETLRLGGLLGRWDLPGPETVLRAAAVLAVAAVATGLRGPGPLEPAHEDAHVLAVGPAVITATSCAVLLLAHAARAPLTVLVAAVVAVLVSATKSLVVYRRITVLNVSHVQARTDDLTGLGNRRALMARLDGVDRGLALALALVDLDRFKAVNDELGHDAGDELLRQVGARLRSLARTGDLVVRQGGDEFAVVLTGAGTAAAATRAGEVVAALGEPFVLHPRSRRDDGGEEPGSHGRVVRVGASVGVASCPQDADGVEALLRAADAAMYRAKRSGGGVGVHGAPASAPVEPPR